MKKKWKILMTWLLILCLCTVTNVGNFNLIAFAEGGEQIENKNDLNLASPSQAEKERPEDHEKATPADAKMARTGKYQSIDISIDQIQSISAPGKYILMQSGTIENSYSIDIMADCELWLDRLDGPVMLYIGTPDHITDRVNTVKIHILNDSTIDAIQVDNNDSMLIIDSCDLEGKSNNTILTLESMTAEKLQMSEIQLNIKNDGGLSIEEGKISNSKINMGDTETGNDLRSASLEIYNSDITAKSLSLWIDAKKNEKNQITFTDCTLDANYLNIGASSDTRDTPDITDLKDITFTFDSSMINIEQLDKNEDIGIQLGDYYSEIRPDVLPLTTLTIKNHSKLSVKTVKGSALLLGGYVKLLVSDAEMILDTEDEEDDYTFVGGIVGFRTIYNEKSYDPQLDLIGDMVIRGGGAFKMDEDGNANVYLPGNSKALKHVEIGKSEGKNYVDALPVPVLTGNHRNDLIAVAKSQLGYEESSTGETIYSAWAGQPGRPWCSEFVAWCANAAGIPQSVIPIGTSSKKYLDFFSAKGRYYSLEGGIASQGNTTNGKKITVSEIESGDLILIESDGVDSNGPDHTAVCIKTDKDMIYCISGNVNDTVMETWTHVSEVYGVCKPDYEENDDDNESEDIGGSSSGGGGGTHSSGSGAAGGSGKRAGNVSKAFIPDYVVKGSWALTADMNWKFTDSNGVPYINKWAAVENPYANTSSGQSAFDWFYFDTNGNMVTGWFWIPDQNGIQKCYYFNPNSDGTRGKLIRNSVIEGNTVNANGEWVLNGIVQTK